MFLLFLLIEVRVCVCVYLYSCLCEFGSLCEFFSGVDIWIVCAFKSSLQLLQLFYGEGCATASLFPSQRQVGF